MCSIFGIFGLQPGDDLQALRRQALDLSQRQRHRGPDWSGVYVDDGAILVHERLAIVDPAGGSQPLLSEDGQLALDKPKATVFEQEKARGQVVNI